MDQEDKSDMTREALFLDVFRGATHAHGISTPKLDEDGQPIVRQRDSKHEYSGRTEPGPLTEANVREHLAGTTRYGIIPVGRDGLCWFAVLDLDEYKANTRLDYLLRPFPGWSFTIFVSKSGGRHLYLFFAEPIPAAVVRAKLKVAAAALADVMNVEIEKVEVFPKQDVIQPERHGNFINCPMFGASNTEHDIAAALRSIKRLTRAEFDALSVDWNTRPVAKRAAQRSATALLASGTVSEGSRHITLQKALVGYRKAGVGQEVLRTLAFRYASEMDPPVPNKEVADLLKWIDTHVPAPDVSEEIASYVRIIPIVPGVDRVAFDIVMGDGRRVPVGGGTQLKKFDAVHTAIFEAITRLIPKRSPVQWEQELKALPYTEELPVESPGTVIWSTLLHFIRDYSHRETPDALLGGDVYLERDGSDEVTAHFSMRDAMKYCTLSAGRARRTLEMELSTVLTFHGGEKMTIPVKGRLLHVWKVRVPESTTQAPREAAAAL